MGIGLIRRESVVCAHTGRFAVLASVALMAGYVLASPVSVRDFGAVGDGKTDDTMAFQKAIDSLQKSGGCVMAPAGQYVVGEIHLRPGVTLQGEPGFGFRGEVRGTVLNLRKDDTSRALIDLTCAYGASVRDLALLGNSVTGRVVHGVGLLKRDFDFNKQEDYVLVDHCLIRDFSGDGIRLDRMWCVNVRNCLINFNRGDGIRMSGWDVFLINNELCDNFGYTIHGEFPSGAATITANRIEWGRFGGLYIDRGTHYCINANYFDGNGSSGLILDGVEHITFTGNQLYRNGKPEFARPEAPYSAHAILTNCRGVTLSSNNFVVGSDPFQHEVFYPQDGLIVSNLVECVVIGNTGCGSCVRSYIVDRGGHKNSVIRDNVGSVYVKPGKPVQ